MKTSINVLFFLACVSLSTSCQVERKQKKFVHVFCDNFPQLKIDSTMTDTVGIKKYIDDEISGNKNDTINFIIECPDNIVFANITLTENILKKQISLYQDERTIVTVYNKCLSEFTPPWVKKNKKIADLSIKVDSTGFLSIDNKKATIDSICKKYHGQNITIQIFADKKLSFAKFIEISECKLPKN